jgi:hypothetical protein
LGTVIGLRETLGGRNEPVARGSSPHLAKRALTVGCACLAWSGCARAAEPSAAEVDERYAFIEAALKRDAPPARLWWTGWVTSYATLTVGQAALALAVKSRGLRIDSIVGGATTLLGVAGTALSSRAAFTGPGELGDMDADTPRARRLRLKRAEDLLHEVAESERLGRSPVTYFGAAAVTLASTFVLWAGYKRYASGWLNLLAGTAVSQLQIATQPTAGLRAWNAYCAGRLTPEVGTRPSLAWSVALTPRGVWLVGSF